MKTYQYLSPTRIAVQAPDMDARFLASQLTYKDPKIDGEMKRLRGSDWARRKLGEDGFRAKMEELKSQLDVCLLKPGTGGYETMSGFSARLDKLGFECTQPLVRQLEDDRLGFALKRDPKPGRYYQEDSVAALLAAGHAGISMSTGAGKSWILEKLIRHHGATSLLMAPTTSIAHQLHDQFLEAFGPKRVGLYGDGKHQSDKQIVVGIAASLTKAKEEHAANLARRDVFCVDESHLCPASTFEYVCNSLAKDAKNRYFVSATQMRNDGTDLVLEGITGPIVYSKTLEQLVYDPRGPFLARPYFFTVDSISESNFWNGDWEDCANRHLWGNKKLHMTAAAIANKLVACGQGPVLILVDHVEQFAHLFGGLHYEVGFAHGPLDPEHKQILHPEFWKSDNKALVNKFNARQLPILVGTSCITTGTDFQPTGSIIYLMAGESEIKVRQCIGRGTRLVDGKKSFNFIDFNVMVNAVEARKNYFTRHFATRCEYYKPFDIKRLPF